MNGQLRRWDEHTGMGDVARRSAETVEFSPEAVDFIEQPRNVLPGGGKELGMFAAGEFISAATIASACAGHANHSVTGGFDESIPAMDPRPRNPLVRTGTNGGEIIFLKRFRHGPTDSRFAVSWMSTDRFVPGRCGSSPT